MEFMSSQSCKSKANIKIYINRIINLFRVIFYTRNIIM